MIRRRVACVCSHESEPIVDAERRALGWRLVPVIAETLHAPACEAFVWLCPSCSGLRNALLNARSAS